MMYPYAEFLLKFGKEHSGFRHQNRGSNRYAAVIVESRPDYFLPLVLVNTMYFLGRDWNLYIICGEMSENYVHQITSGWDVEKRKIRGLYRLSADRYNKLLMSAEFWNLFSEEKILIFQTDSLVCGGNIEEFIDYDYIGAPCGRFDETFVMNGGLSLRTRKTMLQAIGQYHQEKAVEDIFFTESVRKLKAKVPDIETACNFCVESIYRKHPFGVHGTDKYYHSVEVANKILSKMN